MPLIVVANSPDKAAALAGLERWKAKHAEIAGYLAVDDVLIDSMRGRSSTWTRIRVNLRHVPEELRLKQRLPTWMTIRRANGASSVGRKRKTNSISRGRHLPLGKIAASSCAGTTSNCA
jgi:hypothetical protein